MTHLRFFRFELPGAGIYPYPPHDNMEFPAFADVAHDFLTLTTFVLVVGVIIAGQIAVVSVIDARQKKIHAAMGRDLANLQERMAVIADNVDVLGTDHEDQNGQLAWICGALEELRGRDDMRSLFFSAAGGTKLHINGDAISDNNLVEIRVDRAGHEALLASKMMAKTSVAVGALTGMDALRDGEYSE